MMIQLFERRVSVLEGIVENPFNTQLDCKVVRPVPTRIGTN